MKQITSFQAIVNGHIAQPVKKSASILPNTIDPSTLIVGRLYKLTQNQNVKDGLNKRLMRLVEITDCKSGKLYLFKHIIIQDDGSYQEGCTESFTTIQIKNLSEIKEVNHK